MRLGSRVRIFSTEVEKTKIRFKIINSIFNLSFENNKICALDITYKPSGFTTITYYLDTIRIIL